MIDVGLTMSGARAMMLRRKMVVRESLCACDELRYGSDSRLALVRCVLIAPNLGIGQSNTLSRIDDDIPLLDGLKASSIPTVSSSMMASAGALTCRRLKL
jgi:hypothetical protein